MKLVPFLVALTLLGAVASGASAAPRSTATAANLCSVGKGIAASIAKSGSTIAPSAATSITALEKQLKGTFTRIKAAEKVVLANAPGSLKPHFVKVFAFDNMVYSKLSKANWNFIALAKSASSLQAGAARIRPDILAIEAYFNKCKK
jgi:hypothetical protein